MTEYMTTERLEEQGDPMEEMLREVRRWRAEIEELENALHQLADWPERKKTGLSKDELQIVIDELEDHLVYVHKCVRPSIRKRMKAREAEMMNNRGVGRKMEDGA